jgi:hypothetical protein
MIITLVESVEMVVEVDRILVHPASMPRALQFHDWTIGHNHVDVPVNTQAGAHVLVDVHVLAVVVIVAVVVVVIDLITYILTCTPARCTPARCTPSRCTPSRCTPSRCTPRVHAG